LGAIINGKKAGAINGRKSGSKILVTPLSTLAKGHFTWRVQMGAGPNRLDFY
jgi:hypothetical protein